MKLTISTLHWVASFSMVLRVVKLDLFRCWIYSGAGMWPLVLLPMSVEGSVSKGELSTPAVLGGAGSSP